MYEAASQPARAASGEAKAVRLLNCGQGGMLLRGGGCAGGWYRMQAGGPAGCYSCTLRTGKDSD